MVRIVDPRHPLYGLTMPVLRVSQAPGVGPYYVVLFKNNIERRVPVVMTDRSPEPVVIPSLSLDLRSVRQLLTTYQHISLQLAEDTDHGTNEGTNNDVSAVVNVERAAPKRGEVRFLDATRSGVVDVEPGPAAVSEAYAGHHLPPSGQGRDQAEPEGGGER